MFILCMVLDFGLPFSLGRARLEEKSIANLAPFGVPLQICLLAFTFQSPQRAAPCLLSSVSVAFTWSGAE